MDDAKARPSSANQSPTLPAESPTDFIHKPLDYGAPSIRLVRIQASKSPEGFIQCHIRHASTTSTYLCLSYVWGPDDRHQVILVNGQRFRIRQNLYKFLEVAREEPQWRSHWFWIDAICIDQSNPTERNHQVRQMGDIFAGAVQVIAWLGTQKRIVDFLENPMGSSAGAVQVPAWVSAQNQISIFGHLGNPMGISTTEQWRGFHSFGDADYWDRAWITQEVALARQITFMAGKVCLPANEIPFISEGFFRTSLAALFPGTAEELRGRSLIYLMDRFRVKKSGVIRDRVFSLLSLCGDGSDVPIDYETTDLEVADDVLRCCKRSFCLCTMSVIANVLRVRDQVPFSKFIAQPWWSTHAQITLPVTRDHIAFNTRLSLPVWYDIGPDNLTFTLRVLFLCGSYHGKLQIITTESFEGTMRSAKYIEGRLAENIQPIEGCRIVLDHDMLFCTLILSLQFLWQITNVDKLLVRCCERVRDEGTPSAWPSNRPVLTLSG